MRSISAAAASALALSAAAQPIGPLEQPGGPPAPARIVRASPAPVVHPPLNPADFPSIQVNVNADGDNMLDDAANEPSIAVDPTAPNRMAIGWRQFDSIDSDFRQAGHAWTIDGGRTWTFPGPLDPGVFRSDPVLRAADDGTIYYYSLTFQGNDYSCQLFTSGDAGQSWTGPVPAYGGDKAWIAVDRTGGPGHGNLYAAWDNAGCCGDDWFTRAPAGQGFEAPVPIAGRPVWGTSTVGPDGVVYTSGRSVNSYSIFILSRSANAQDPGQTPTFQFSEVPLGGALRFNIGTGPNPGGLLGQVSVAADHSAGPHAGAIYVLCSVNPDGPDPLDVIICRSDDGGQTWNQAVKVNDEAPNTNAWQWFGTLAVAPDGRIDVVWNDTVTDDSTTSELRGSSSTDGGQTWAPHQTLGPAWDSHVGWPQQTKIGDYYDMESDLVGASLAYAATYNGEQDVYFLRIGDYDCNGNGVGDADDLAGGAAADCNGNSIPDSCEIAAGAEADANGDGIPDSCQACYPDFDADGTLTIFDFLTYFNEYNLEEDRADCNHDGAFDFFDFLCYIAAFNAGC